MFEGVLGPPIGRPNRQPNGSLIQSGETAESIHFAPPLTSPRQHGAKLSAGFQPSPMIFRVSVIPIGNNGLIQEAQSLLQFVIPNGLRRAYAALI
jgi:hypothetical protein